MSKPFRPALRYHGGKWKLAPWIISHFPPHRIYTESFGGAMSVLLRKPPVYAEVYNDRDDEVVGFFRALRGPRAQELVEKVRLTPFARTEFAEAYQPSDCPVESARRLLVRSFMGFGSDGHNGARPTGFRSNSHRSGTTPARDWANYPEAMLAIIDRLQAVIIENRDAMQVMAAQDRVDCLHYVDPPYLHSTRAKVRNSERKNYKFELSDDEHRVLLDFLQQLDGMVVLSGYPSEIYDDALKGWARVERVAMADGAKPRTEVLWLNPAVADRLSGRNIDFRLVSA